MNLAKFYGCYNMTDTNPAFLDAVGPKGNASVTTSTRIFENLEIFLDEFCPRSQTDGPILPLPPMFSLNSSLESAR